MKITIILHLLLVPYCIKESSKLHKQCRYQKNNLEHSKWKKKKGEGDDYTSKETAVRLHNNQA